MGDKKKILLIYPPSPVMNREDRCQQPTQDLLVIPPLPPVDLMYLAAIAEKAGVEAKIADYSLGGNLEEDLKQFSPDYVVANIATPTLKTDFAALKFVKKILPKAITIAKGAIFLEYNSDMLYKHKYVDLILIGECEETLAEILSEKPLAKIRGISYRDGFVAKFTGRRPAIKNLDELPFPARNLIDNTKYVSADSGELQAVIKVSRGCSHHCFFCLATPVSGSKIRRRTPENIIAEIKECQTKYGINNFIFWSDCFNCSREWVMELCDKIIESDLDISWISNLRADKVDEEMAEIMHEAGCDLVCIGAESGSQYILDKIGKKITLDQIRNTVKIFKSVGIKVYNYFILGLPWEDEESAERTIEFATELDGDYTSFYTATPLPGTLFYTYALEKHLINAKTVFDCAYYKPVVKTHCLSKERVFEIHKNAVRRFYLRPRYIFRTLKKIRSFKEVKNYFNLYTKLLLRK